jgi:MoxR-like ATPase
VWSRVLGPTAAAAPTSLPRRQGRRLPGTHATVWSVQSTSVAAIHLGPERATEVARRIADNVALALEGKRDVIELCVTALLAHGHLLVEDVPGVGKTTLARALAQSIGVGFRRVQFTSDLMPTDVLGGSVYDPATGRFSFRPGPVFTNVLLADEINRATPRTQSALLEAMEERQVSLDGTTRVLEEPFFVIATQNPQELYGTYPLPESQLDRFLLCTPVGYPAPAAERLVLGQHRRGLRRPELPSVVDRATLTACQAAVDEVRVEEVVVDYLHAIILGTRTTPALALGASTRAAIALERAARAQAIVRGRAFVTLDDVRALAAPVLAHRVRLPSPGSGEATRAEAERAIAAVVEAVPVPI